jgi:hypothetical protein
MDLPLCAARKLSNARSMPAFAVAFGALAIDIAFAQMSSAPASDALRRQIPFAVTVTVNVVLAAAELAAWSVAVAVSVVLVVAVVPT